MRSRRFLRIFSCFLFSHKKCTQSFIAFVKGEKRITGLENCHFPLDISNEFFLMEKYKSIREWQKYHEGYMPLRVKNTYCRKYHSTHVNEWFTTTHIFQALQTALILRCPFLCTGNIFMWQYMEHKCTKSETPFQICCIDNWIWYVIWINPI